MSHNPDELEKSLVERCRSGDREAWDLLFETHYPTISAVASWRKWRFQPEDQEDIIQEILAEVVKALNSFEQACSLSTFVHRISVNTCITCLRRKAALKRRSSQLQTPLDMVGSGDDPGAVQLKANPESGPEELLLAKERVSFLRNALAALEERCKELITLRYLMELSFAEIAERTGAKTNTLVVQLKRCLNRLFKMIEGEI